MTKSDRPKLSDNALSLVFSNLAKAAEKQQYSGPADTFTKLSEKYQEAPSKNSDFTAFKEHLTGTLKEDYPGVQKKAEEIGDRGVLRALRWGEKVTTIQKSLVDRFLSKGETLMEGKDLFLCEACGFIFLGNSAPDICPVCKAPASRFIKIK